MDITEILDLIQRNTNTQNTTTSSYTTVAKTLDVNLALVDYMVLANSAAGNWRPADDTNQSDYPIVYADIVSGQQDLSFTVDENGNQILDIYKVRIKNAVSGNWTTLEQINQDTITDAQLDTSVSSIPSQYYLNSNGIFLVQKPNFALTDGLEIWISRTPIYFTAADVATGTKKPGIYWMHHKYLALKPSYQYASQKGLNNKVDLERELYGRDGRSGLEGAIKKYWRDRNKDFTPVITSESINSV